VTVKYKIQVVKIIIFTKATVVKTTEPGPTCRLKGQAKARPGPMDAMPLPRSDDTVTRKEDLLIKSALFDFLISTNRQL